MMRIKLWRRVEHHTENSMPNNWVNTQICQIQLPDYFIMFRWTFNFLYIENQWSAWGWFACTGCKGASLLTMKWSALLSSSTRRWVGAPALFPAKRPASASTGASSSSSLCRIHTHRPMVQQRQRPLFSCFFGQGRLLTNAGTNRHRWNAQGKGKDDDKQFHS